MALECELVACRREVRLVLGCELAVVMMLEWAGLGGCGLAMRARK